jgi:integrase
MQEQTPHTALLPPIAKRLGTLWPRLAQVIEAAQPAPSASTIKQYCNAMRRMAEGNQWPEEIGKLNRKSFNYYRAALLFCTVESIRKEHARITDEGDTISRVEAELQIDRIKNFLGILRRYPPNGGIGDCRWSAPPEGQTRKGKRRGMSRLPLNWREMIANACPATSEYAAPLLLSALVGLRPIELQHGVIVAVKHDHIVVRINGAKVTANTGQPARGIAFPVDNVIAQRLARMVTERGKHGLLRVSINVPRKFCDFVRSLSRQLFPPTEYVVTPYTFRHGFASDQKAQRAGGEVLAKALGHVSARSQKAYGSAGQGRRPLVTITAVEAPRTVRALDRTNGYKAQQTQQNRAQDSAPDMLPGR